MLKNWRRLPASVLTRGRARSASCLVVRERSTPVDLKMGGKGLWLSGAADFVKEAEGVEFVQLTGGRPAQLLPHVRYVVKLPSARDSTQRKVQDILEALCFSDPFSKTARQYRTCERTKVSTNMGSRWDGIC